MRLPGGDEDTGAINYFADFGEIIPYVSLHTSMMMIIEEVNDPVHQKKTDDEVSEVAKSNVQAYAESSKTSNKQVRFRN